MKIRMVGDVHGNKGFVFRMMKSAFHDGVDKVVLLGDVGLFWNGTDEFEQYLSKQADITQIPIYVLDGNHENHGRLAKYHDADGEVRLRDGVTYLPRGFSWEWNEKKFLSIGGAFSIDYRRRIPGVSWWDNEEPNVSQVNRAIDAGKVDFVLAHDAPIQSKIPFPMSIASDLEKRAKVNRKAMGAILESTQPSVWFHGHYHVPYQNVVTLENGAMPLVVGLGCDTNDFADSFCDWNI